MWQAFVLVLGALLGFLGSRMLRRPSHAADAASMARSVGGALGRRRGLALPVLQRAAFSEMIRHVRVGRDGQAIVPTRYVLRLHPTDASAVEEAPRFFTDGLAEALRAAAVENGWKIDGAISIDVVADDSRRPGTPAVLAVPPDGPASAAAGPPPDSLATVTSGRRTDAPAAAVGGRRRMRLHRLDTDELFLLTAHPVTIGRASTRTIVVDDNRISRQHAVVRPDGSGWVVADEGSSNGTRLNGSALDPNSPATLRTGDTIEVGPVRFRFEVDDSSPAPPDQPVEPPAADQPTMTLDDATRRRISSDYVGRDTSAPRDDLGPSLGAGGPP